ncbi:delta-60 repeat domain-containing protein [Streptomyces sp. B21-106]
MQSDGKIVVGGTVGSTGSTSSLMRLHADGSVDTGFDGRRQSSGTGLRSGLRVREGLALQPDGRSRRRCQRHQVRRARILPQRSPGHELRPANGEW